MKQVISLMLVALMLTITSVRSEGTRKPFEFDSNHSISLQQKQWFGGLEDCRVQETEPFDIYMLSQTTWILRQSKCDTWEAPFIYLLIGQEKALLLDTGAITKAEISPLAPTIDAILSHIERPDLPLLIVHSHSHSDHTKGDRQFDGRAATTIIPAKTSAIAAHLGTDKLSNIGHALNLGNRIITILPTPGHHDEAITLYDTQDKLLLTGDTLYPGMIIVKDWKAFQSSVALLHNFATTNPIQFILGGHIEMSARAGVMYPIGSQYQPDEHSLVLTTKHLKLLNNKLQESKKQTLVFDAFEIAPMNGLQKLISGFAGFLTGN